MAISDTITSMYDNIENVYDILELAGADLTNVDKNIFNLKETWKERLLYFMANGTDVVWNNWLPKVTGSGETITLNNTIEAKMDFVYKGNTYQESTTGYNLFKTPYNESSTTKNGITFTINEDGSIHVEGTATAKTQFALRNKDKILDLSVGETYTVATSGLGTLDSTVWLDTYGQTRNFLGKWALTQNAPYTSAIAEAKDNIPTISITVENGATINTNVKVWLYKGSYDAEKDYEPYTNGASPNPDYPQEIEVVTGNNSIRIANNDNTQSQTYPINLGNIELCKIGTYQDSIKKSTGKNLANFKTINSLDIINGYVNLSPTYSSGFTATITIDEIILPAGNYTLGFKTSSSQTITSTQTLYINNSTEIGAINYYNDYCYANITLSNTTTISNFKAWFPTGAIGILSEMILIKGTYNTTNIPTYEPYGKVWYLNKEIGKVVFNGSENWDKNSGASTSGGYYEFSTVLKDNTEQIDLLCNNFNVSTSYSSTNEQVRNRTDTRIYINILGTRLSTQDTNGFKIWLSNHNTTLYYQLSTPTTTEITDSTLIYQLEATKKSYNNQTNISQENSKEAFILDVTALGN